MKNVKASFNNLMNWEKGTVVGCGAILAGVTTFGATEALGMAGLDSKAVETIGHSASYGLGGLAVASAAYSLGSFVKGLADSNLMTKG